MKKLPFILLLCAALTGSARADTRWCSVTSLGEKQNLFYPPIARAARVHGVVLGRVIYLPNGGLQSYEKISGPGMLSDSLNRQLKEWTFNTNAKGDEPCQTLIIAEFSLDDSSGMSSPKEIDVTIPSILRL